MWEWTSSDFLPYPGFTAWPYKEYSEVFFGPEYKVLRGGAFGVSPVACRGTFRNWDYPIRRQIFAGFRTARSEAGRYRTPRPVRDGARLMCRHLAYLGPPASLRSLLIDPPHSLYRQAWAPRRQRHGTVNADGFGIGWYAERRPGPGAVPAGRADLGRPVAARPRAGHQVGRGARRGPLGHAGHGARASRRPRRSAAAPGCSATTGRLTAGRLGRRRRRAAPPGCVPAAAAPARVAAIGAALLSPGGDGRLRVPVGARPCSGCGRGCRWTPRSPGPSPPSRRAGGTGRFNFLLTDGHSIAATACGDTLWYRRVAAGGPSSVASEPDDDEPGWTEVPDRHVLTATPSLVRVRPLSGSARPTGRSSPARHRPRQPADHTRPAGNDVRTEGILTR